MGGSGWLPRLWFALCWLLCTAAAPAATAAVMEVGAGAGRIELASATEVLEDAAGALGVREAAASSGFQAASPARGRSASAFWFRYTFVNRTDRAEWWLDTMLASEPT
jgi:hypothetical protein